MPKNLRALLVVLSSTLCLLGCKANPSGSTARPDRTVNMVIREIKNCDQGPHRVKLVEYLDVHYPTDEKVIDFYLDVIHRYDRLMLMDLSTATHVRSPRLIEPLMQWIRTDQGRSHASHFVLVMLYHQRPVTEDRGQISAELGHIMLGHSRWFGPAAPAPTPDQWFGWRQELDDLALTGDPALVPVMVPWLDRRDVVLDAHQLPELNNGVSTRVCDATYNALRVLLDLPGEPLSPHGPRGAATVEEAYARRDALIAQLKQQLAHRKQEERS